MSERRTQRMMPREHGKELAETCLELGDKAWKWRERARLAEDTILLLQGLLAEYDGQQTPAGDAFKAAEAAALKVPARAKGTPDEP